MNDKFGPVVAHERKSDQKRAYILDFLIAIKDSCDRFINLHIQFKSETISFKSNMSTTTTEAAKTETIQHIVPVVAEAEAEKPKIRRVIEEEGGVTTAKVWITFSLSRG
jgi:hypothetical protein